MASPDRGADILDMERSRRSIQSIADSDIDWKNYMTRDERARVVPAESLAEEAERKLHRAFDTIFESVLAEQGNQF